MNWFLSLISAKIFKICIVLFLILLSGIGGYYIGNLNGSKILKTNQVETDKVNISPSKTIVSSPSISPTPTPQINTHWGGFSQEFMNDNTFSVFYPLDNKHNPFISYAKDSGWPISQLERLFITNVSFGDYRVGVSEVDPTLCYKDTCTYVLDSITKEENVNIDGINSKKITAEISQKGGGIILPGKISESILYIIPYQNKYIILFSFYPDLGFKKFVSSFEVKPNTVGHKNINPETL
jgi:hypothetical protein